MRTAELYRRFAGQCERVAAAISGPNEKDRLFVVAEQCRQLAAVMEAGRPTAPPPE
jgi:hypothetical protein